jgi:membrane protease YdiL (CAAX protease family)
MMTTVAPPTTHVRSLSPTGIQAGVVATGLAILVARPTIAGAVGSSAPVLIGLFSLILALGLAPPSGPRPARPGLPLATVVGVFVAGGAVFVAGRILSGGHSPAPATVALISLNTLAAVAEEALFRRVAFAALLPAGPVVAVAGSAVVFGLAHVTVYGWWAFPLDVAAGVVLGWQRWASGTWLVPAATHALADLLVVI